MGEIPTEVVIEDGGEGKALKSLPRGNRLSDLLIQLLDQLSTLGKTTEQTNKVLRKEDFQSI